MNLKHTPSSTKDRIASGGESAERLARPWRMVKVPGCILVHNEEGFLPDSRSFLA